MIDYIICENNLEYLNKLNNIVTGIMIKNNVAYNIKLYSDYTEEFMKEIYKNDKTKVYILDIETPTSSGLKIATKIRNVDLNSYIIFCTGHENLGLQAINLDSFFTAFIDKTSNVEQRLRNTIEKTVLNTKGENMVNIQTKLISYQFKYIDILFIYRNSFSRKTVVHTTNGEHAINLTLNNVMKYFDDRFVQSHRACYVNKMRIEKIDLSNNIIYFNNNSKTDLLSYKYKKELNLNVI